MDKNSLIQEIKNDLNSIKKEVFETQSATLGNLNTILKTTSEMVNYLDLLEELY